MLVQAALYNITGSLPESIHYDSLGGLSHFCETGIKAFCFASNFKTATEITAIVFCFGATVGSTVAISDQKSSFLLQHSSGSALFHPNGAPVKC
jgi:hypothetical protein